jgi:carboxyl-terminal processing protease
MTQRLPMRQWPVTFFLYLVCAFGAGVLLERGIHLLAPYSQAPAGVEKTFEPFWETWHLVDRYFVNRAAVDPEAMTRGAIRGMLSALGDDEHTRYVTPDELKELKQVLEGHMEGIGATLSLRDGRPTIVNTMPNSPARSAGVRPGDIILEVNGKDVATLPLDQIVSKVRGQAGTEVQMRLARVGRSEPLDLTITRAEMKVPDVSWIMVPGVPIAHLAIRNFGEKAGGQVKAAIQAARAKGARGLIVDLRGNPGGIKDQAVAVTSEFLKSGNVYLDQNAAGNRTPVPVIPGGTAADLPLDVLIDLGTASSAEIFAGALQDHHRGKLIGTRTVGTGTVLEPFSLSDGSAVLLAVSEWLTPEGRQIWHKGITPDIPVPLPLDASILLPDQEIELTAAQFSKSSDKQLLKALEVLKQEMHLGGNGPTKK